MTALTTETSTEQRVAAFAASVRSHLDDLPAEDVDDLVEGLEADLTEQAAESPDFALPDAAAYAAELRAAAGLPDRTAPDARRPPLRDRVGGRWTRTIAAIRGHRAGDALLDFFVALRPVWWIARAWMLFVVLAPLVGAGTRIPGFPGENFGGWILFGALVVLSVQWGRGRWIGLPGLRVVRTVVSVLTALALPFALIGTVGAVRSLQNEAMGAYGPAEYQDPGLVLGGERIRNIFAYDAEGRPIEGAQLFDQDGRPLATVGVQAEQGSWDMDYYFAGGGGPATVPILVPGRAPVWNVFPLSEIPADAWMDGSQPSATDAVAPAFPFPFVPALPAEKGASDAAAGDPTPSASPSATP